MKVMGVAAPHWIAKGTNSDSISLNSSDPFSLYNAYRYAAGCAEKNIGYWGKSNWNSFEGRKESIILMNYYYNEVDKFKDKLLQIKPDILFVGAMTLAFAGAIEISKIAKNILGEKVFIVLGGKHALETMYLENGEVINENSSPLKLMQDGKIEKIFDLIIAGDGEYTIFNVGNIIGKLLEKNSPMKDFYNYIGILGESKGNWVIGWIQDEEMRYLTSKCQSIDYDEIPITAELFPIRTKFSIFNADLTAHAFSDISKGCIFNCFYCSERNNINGKLRRTNVESSPYRLARYLKSIEDIGDRRYNHSRMSAFVEDSILLAGDTESLDIFNKMLEEEQVNIEFGGQFTVDTLLKNKYVVRKLRDNGFKYVFFGIETINNDIAKRMSKNLNNGVKWIDKNEEAIKFLNDTKILCGVSVLFGLGESQGNRIEILNRIELWMKEYKNLCVVSLNWAVQHPLRGNNDGLEYDYTEWGTDKDSPYLGIFTELFGEASEKYCISGVKLPKLEELEELKLIYDRLCLLN